MSGRLSAALVDSLRKERARIITALEALDELIRFAEEDDAAGELSPPGVPPKGRPGRKRRYDWDEGRRLYEEEGWEVADVARHLGCARASVTDMKRREGWRRRPDHQVDQGALESALAGLGWKAPAAFRGATAAIKHHPDVRDLEVLIKAAVAYLGGNGGVRCDTCEGMTRADPCEHCHTRLPKATAARLESAA